MTEKVNLSLVPISDMIDEIADRSGSMLLSRTFKGSRDSEQAENEWRGSLLGCFGLLRVFEKDLEREIEQHRQEEK